MAERQANWSSSNKENVASAHKKSPLGSRSDFTIDDDDFEVMAKGFCPKNTTTSNQWALSNFNSCFLAVMKPSLTILAHWTSWTVATWKHCQSS